MDSVTEKSDDLGQNQQQAAGGQIPTFKVVIVGDSGVGKTCLLKRYSEGTFSDLEEATLGAQFSALKMDAEYGTG